ncbi:MAG: carboxypeptidase regulatory-like domain-containing protein [Acidobacteriota bacterium]
MQRIRILVTALVCAGVALAQTNKGRITGTVFDKLGAVIPAATVTITNVGTNESIRLTTSESGVFSAPLLDPVTYRVTVEVTGFKKAVIENVKVDTAAVASVNVTLDPGQVTTEVTVTAEPDVVNSDSGALGQTITERQITEMPLNNRSVLDLALTAGNVTGVAGTEDPELGSEIPAPGFNVNVNGGRAGSTSILADGASNTGVGLGRAVVTFSPDTVQEFTVQTSNFSAEFGQTGGGVINMTTKSGTNQYNGLLYWYHRNPSLNAAPFTTAANNRPESNRRQHQFGLTYGGPLVLPRVYDGHNRTFFFVAAEPRYYYDGSQFTALLPTEPMLRGDFSDVVRVNGGYAPGSVAERFGVQNQIQDATLYNQFEILPGNRFRRLTLAAGETYPVFPGNSIPASMIDPVSQQLLQYLPKAGDYFLSDGNLRNYASSNFIRNLERRLTVRIDHQVTPFNRLTGRYTQVPIRGDRGRGDFQVGRDEVNTGGTDYSWSRQVLLTDTHTFSAHVFNELRLNYTFGRFTRNFPPMFDSNNGRNLARELGLPSLTQGGLPEFATGALSIGFSQSQQNENAEHSYGITDSLSWVRGRMTLKLGADLSQQRLKTIPMFGASGGRYEFNRNRTLTNNNGQGNGTGGVEFAQFLLGVYNLATLREVFIPYYYQWNSAAGFVQNDWKVRPNLTLNLGLRYALQLPRTEKFDRQGAFLPQLAKEFPIPQPCPAIQAGPMAGTSVCQLPDGRTVTSALVIPFGFSGRGGRSRYIFPVEKTNFEPRLGLAYVPRLFGWNRSGRVVFRAGWGVSHAPLTGMGRNPSPDFAAGTTGFGTFDNRIEFPGTNVAARLCCNRPVLTPLTPEQFLQIPEDGLVYLNGINIAGSAVSDSARVPYVQSWSATLAWELPQQTALEISYVGSKGTHLFLPPVNLNPVPFEITESYLGIGVNPLDNVNDPLGRLNATGTGVFQFSQGYVGTKYLGFEGLTEMFNASANSIRHAGALSVRRRHNRGLSYVVNYTFGKSIDEASDAGDVRFVNLNVRSPGHVNFGAPRSLDRSVSTFDIKHHFSSSFLYDLPFGRRRMFLPDARGWLGALAGGWSLSGIGRIQGGIPMVAVLRDDNRLGVEGNVRAIRADVVPGVPLLNPRWSRACPTGADCEPYFNPAAFMRPAKGTLGNAPRTFDGARSPTQQFLDLSVQKNFSLGRESRRRLQFRVDLINALNHPVFRTGRLEDAGEIFALPGEGLITNAEYDAWARAASGRPGRTTPEGAAALAQINAIVADNRVPGTQTLRRDFFRVPLPEGFFSMNANSFELTTPEGLKLYRLRQAYTGDRWGFLAVSPGRSGYTPRFVQFAVKIYF